MTYAPLSQLYDFARKCPSCVKPHVADLLTRMKADKLALLLQDKGYPLDPNPDRLNGKKLIALRMQQIMRHMRPQLNDLQEEFLVRLNRAIQKGGFV